jgi:hypothetical protein
VYSIDPTLPALTIDGSFAASDSVTIANFGLIFGAGGDGAGAAYSGGYIAVNGQDGGSAISTSKNFALYNASFIGGGGGGGGGVAIGSLTYPFSAVCGGGGMGGGYGGPRALLSPYYGPGATTVGGSGGNGGYGHLAVIPASPLGVGGGGGGLTQYGTSTSGPLYYSTTAVFNGVGGYGATGSGTGGAIGDSSYSGVTQGYGGQGVGSNGVGGPGFPQYFTGSPGGIFCSGGGGGWGQAGGIGAFYSFGTHYLLTPGAAGKAIALNGNTVTYITNNTIWGPVA